MHNEWERLGNTLPATQTGKSDHSPSVWLWAPLKDPPLLFHLTYPPDRGRVPQLSQCHCACAVMLSAAMCFTWRQGTKVGSRDWQLAAMKCGQSGSTAFLVYTPLPCAREPMSSRWRKKKSLMWRSYVCGDGLHLCSSDVIWKTCCFPTVITVCVCVFY